MPHPDLGREDLNPSSPVKLLPPPPRLRKPNLYLPPILRKTRNGLIARIVFEKIPEARAITQRLAWHISDQLMASYSAQHSLLHLCITEGFNWLAVNLNQNRCETREDALNVYLIGLFRGLPDLCATSVSAGNETWDALYDPPLTQWLIDTGGAEARPADENSVSMSRDPRDVRSGLLYRVAMPDEIAQLRYIPKILDTRA